MSIYADVLRLVKDNPNQTQTQLSALVGAPSDTAAVIKVLAMLVTDGRVTLTGIPSTGTYASTSQQ